jgi:hypothetical protein
MLRLRSLFALGLFAAMAFATQSQLNAGGQAKGQPKGQPNGGFKVATVPLTTVLLPYMGDENLQKELKLSEDQTKKLLTFRKKYWDETYTTAPKDLAPERNKIIEAEFKAVLNADQFERAHQIAAQLVWDNRPRGGGFGIGPGGGPIAALAIDSRRTSAIVLLQYPELATPLKLDDTQKKLLESAFPGGGGPGRARGMIYLTPEQSTAVKELLGSQLKIALQFQRDERMAFRGPGGGAGFGGPGFAPGGLGGGGGFGGFGTIPALQYTMSKDVQKEIKLSDEQAKSLDKVRQELSMSPVGVSPREQSPEELKKAADESRAETVKAVEKILSAEQRKRLDQIERQQQAGFAEFYEGSFLGKELGVTEAQRKQHAEKNAAHAEVVAKILLSGEPLDKTKSALEAATKEFDKSLEALITPDQQAKKKDLLGTAFVGQLYGNGGFGGGGSATVQRELSFGRYTNQLATLTRYKGLQDGLKVSDDQLKEIAAHSSEMNTKFPTVEMIQALQDAEKGAKFFEDRSAFIEKALADVLTKEQQTRFRQLMIQWLESGLYTSRVVVASGAAYPGVAREIKLTVEQRKKLLADEAPSTVLTDAQKKAIKDMEGEPAKIAEIFSRPNLPPGAIPNPAPWLQLLLNTAMWDAIKLTPAQTKSLVHAANEYMVVVAENSRGGFGGGFGGPGGAPPMPPGNEKLVAGQEAFAKAAESILTPEQRKRLDQLAIQQRAASSLHSTLTTGMQTLPAAAKALSISPEQTKKINAMADELYAIGDLLNPLTIDYTKENEIRMKLRDRLDERIVKELTPEQLSKWKELIGEPCDVFVKQPLYGRGGFGFGGGGFGGGFGGPFGP